MSAMTFQLEDCPGLVGLELRGEPFRISPAECEQFGRSTGIHDLYPPDRPTGYPDGMLAGFHSLGLLEFAVDRTLRFDPTRHFTYFYGLDRVRFPSSITTSDDLVLLIRVAAAEPRSGGYLMSYDLDLAARGSARPALVARSLTLVVQADHGESD